VRRASRAAGNAGDTSISLTIGTGPFGERPAGTFNVPIDAPEGILYFEDVPHRIRAIFERETIVDSLRAKLLHESGRLPVYYFPEADLRADLLERSDRVAEDSRKGKAVHWSVVVGARRAEDAVWSYTEPSDAAHWLAGHYTIAWGGMDEWFAEDEQLFGHPRDPYSRIDVYKSSRHLRVLRDGEVLADTRRAKVLFETALPPRWYIPAEDVRTELLVPTSTKTRCAYKGSASYWSVRVGDRMLDDLVWTYAEPQHDAEPVRDLLCFFNERVDLDIDGEVQERPKTQWSRDD
jgi:uncharacterized protein (DUF427 family)